MWQSTKELREKGDIDGTLIWGILEQHYPGNKEKQTSLLGFMNDYLTEQKRHHPKGVPSDVLIELARKWGVERAVVTEALRHLPGTQQYLAATASLPLTYEEKRHKTLAAFLEMGEWYVRHQHPMPIKEMRAIGTKYFGTGDDYTEFLEYFRSPEGLKEFRHELRQIMRDHRISIPPEEEWLPLTDLEQRYVRVLSPGQTTFNIYDLVPLELFNKENERVKKLGENPATGEIWEGGKPRRLPQTTPPVTVFCPICKKNIEIPGYDKVTRSGALQRHIEKEHPPGHGQYPQTIVGGEPIPPEYRDLIGFINEALPEYSLAVLPAIEAGVGERKIDVVLKQLKDGVEGIQDSAQFRLFLTTMAKFHNYSIGNQILIMIQRRDASHVAGFNTWKDLGRWVKRGEKGIAILAPMMPPKPKKEELEAEEEEIQLAPVYFKVVHIFDISQTEGKPLPEFDVPTLTGEANEELFAKVLALAKAQGLEVSFESRPEQNPAIKGQYSGKSIWVKGDEPRAQQLKSLLHEVAHYYSEGVFRIPRRDAETIAESAAFAVGAHYGFDSGVRSFPYVALWAQDKKVLQENLGAIRKVTSVILDSLETTQVVEEKMVPALKPFEPYHFAEWVLRYNRFSEAEIPIYSGLTGRAPLRVPDHIWREVIEATEGDFVKQGDLYVFHIPEKERPSYMRAAPTWRDIASTEPLKLSPAVIPTEPTGTCYEDAWRFLIREEEGELIHGSVRTIGKRINHAWVELPSLVWEPKSGESMRKDYFYEIAEPQEQARYTNEEAAIMAARTGNLGPWTDQERKQYLKGESPAVIPTQPSPPSLKEELEFVSDSPEYLAYTIEDIGYREKLDTAFETAIARARGE